MNRMLIAAPFMALVLSGCVVAPAEYGSGVVMAPALPVVVELGADPYYYQSGYYYHYNNGNWRYSTSRSGTWADLPRNHYPRETRFKGRDDRRGDRDGDGRRDQDNDRRDNDRRDRR
jgi:hypothetical protein